MFHCKASNRCIDVWITLNQNNFNKICTYALQDRWYYEYSSDRSLNGYWLWRHCQMKSFPERCLFLKLRFFALLDRFFMGDIDKTAVIFIYLPLYFHFKTTYTCSLLCIYTVKKSTLIKHQFRKHAQSCKYMCKQKKTFRSATDYGNVQDLTLLGHPASFLSVVSKVTLKWRPIRRWQKTIKNGQTFVHRLCIYFFR